MTVAFYVWNSEQYVHSLWLRSFVESVIELFDLDLLVKAIPHNAILFCYNTMQTCSKMIFRTVWSICWNTTAGLTEQLKKPIKIADISTSTYSLYEKISLRQVGWFACTFIIMVYTFKYSLWVKVHCLQCESGIYIYEKLWSKHWDIKIP